MLLECHDEKRELIREASNMIIEAKAIEGYPRKNDELSVHLQNTDFVQILQHLYLRAAVREADIKFLIGEVPGKITGTTDHLFTCRWCRGEGDGE